MVIIGTSGSHDYLKDVSADRRFWPVSAASADIPPVSPEDRAIVQEFVEVTGGTWLGEAGVVCDGLHDEEAPAIYLCTRCFPDPVLLGGDLSTCDEQDDYRDEPEEME